MGFTKGLIKDKETVLLDFGYGDMHLGICYSVRDDVLNTLVISEGRPMPIGEMTEDNKALSNHVDFPKSIKNGNVQLMRFNKSASVDAVINRLETIKQNLIENGK